jgi:GH25 family lysozyme M1 (1,4-beta-N-acetylmuramidase)
MSFIKLKGVDISGANGDVDFEMLKRNGISVVMIK